MLKRIRTQDLTLGMFLHEFCGSWMEHPFWRSQFLLQDPQDLLRIRQTSIQEVWIDTGKGRDVAASVVATTREEADAAIETTFSALAEMPSYTAPTPAVQQLHTRTGRVNAMEEELIEAAEICRRSKSAVVSMFNEARLGRALEVPDLHDMVDEIAESVARHPNALISLARLKSADDYTYMHSVAVCALMMALGKQIKLNDQQLRTAGMAGLLHDLGKARIPLAVLNKPGKLTDEEFAIVRNHPAEGYRMLLMGGLQDAAVLDACLHHHEKIDGTGYPEKLNGSSISLIAKMAAICDVYDAITSDRPYKRGWDPSESLRRMAEWSHAHFDTQLLQAFVKSLGIYPVGSLVRLTSGRIGVVIEQNPGALLLPRVNTFFCTKTDQRIAPEELDLSLPGCSDKIAAREDPEHWHFPDMNTLCFGMEPLPW
ncbi:MAG: HD-GYP domain-containing protein [Giesbergeria sp.]|nr:HD-GYP domain-containing protein [Giesbergeria sp.]